MKEISAQPENSILELMVEIDSFLPKNLYLMLSLTSSKMVLFNNVIVEPESISSGISVLANSPITRGRVGELSKTL